MLALRCRQWSRCRLAYIVMQWCSDVHHAWQCPRIAVRQSRGLPRDPTRHDRHGSGRLSVKRQLGVAMDGSEIQRSQNETYEKRVKRKTSANQSTPGSFLWLFAMLLMEVSTTNTIAQLNFAANRKAMLQTTGLLRKNLSVWNISSLLPQGLCLCWHCMLAFQQQGCDKKSPDQMVQERFSTGPHFFFKSCFSGVWKLETCQTECKLFKRCKMCQEKALLQCDGWLHGSVESPQNDRKTEFGKEILARVYELPDSSSWALMDF